MVRSSRPELIKDNPAAPQIYIGPRRRRALAAQGLLEETTPAVVEQEPNDTEERVSRTPAPKRAMRKKIAAVVEEAIGKGPRTKRRAR